jgi:peptidylprolyl isomerase
VQRSQIPPDITPEIGMTLSIRLEDGSTPHVHISAMDEETITLDANHPLAGQDLIFELALVKIG